ncbi:uncharacterized protein LOC114579172 [Dendrobium catenatum]|uniref:uncharacterized protein LOC114579172 n=1 Tax=Dendrobium catenatum TaxID=906689 RepID=UPI00109FECDE|nr:uncharacterized protein LOC114579172 [Dendrobium catenatum]
MSTDDWFINSHQIFPNEHCCNNFFHASPGRIWLKWNASSISFSPSHISSQLIHGTLRYDSVNCIKILVVYAANTASERTPLWNQFQFKNYWLNIAGCWDGVITVFASQPKGNPIAAFYSKLNSLKEHFKSKNWGGQFLSSSLHEAKCSWISQRAKARWLSNGEDDLGFLYARIKMRKNSSHIKEITTDESYFTNHEAVFDGSSSSAPGPDGYNFEFYKKSWPLIDTQICKAIKYFFHTGILPKRAKATAITLIPKSPHASNISDFRPIYLCNVFYTIIAKILANRMKDIMPLIIHKSQAGLVHGRVSTDNIMLATKILSCFNSTSRDELFYAKLDIKKAFDTVSRDFLLTRMLLNGFPEPFVKSVKGCPLSPLLFSIVMDAFSCVIDDSSFLGINNGNYNYKHLLYADDLLVFGNATMNNAALLLKSLNSFAEATGLYINNTKCSIIFSFNSSLTEDINLLMGVLRANVCLTYLGLPISTKKLNSTYFLPLLSKLFTLLAGWKNRFLSFAGRLQFLRFSIANTLAYWIRGSIIPKSVCKLIDKMCSRFLFHGSTNLKKLHLIAWNKTCLPKCFGGLGIPSIDSLYFPYACSFIWRLYNQDSMLAMWRRKNYHSPWKQAHSKATKFWKIICNTAVKIQDSVTFNVGSENCLLSMLWDPWCLGKPLEEALSHISPSHTAVKDFIKGGVWDVPESWGFAAVNHIRKVPIINSSCHTISWAGNDKACFKTFYLHYYRDLQPVSWHPYIWHKRYALHYSSFAWLAVLGGLKTAEALAIRNIMVCRECSLCSVGEDNTSHIFFQCDYTFKIVSHLLPALNKFLLMPTMIQCFDFFNDHPGISTTHKNFCFLVLCCSIYFIWRERNDRRFGSTQSTVNAIIRKIVKALRAKSLKWGSVERLKQDFQGVLVSGAGLGSNKNSFLSLDSYFLSPDDDD